jgi:hypothetical protein
MTPAQLYLNISCNNIDALGVSKNEVEHVIDELILPEIKQQLLDKYQIYCQGAKNHSLAKDNVELNDKDIVIKSQLYVGD